MVADTVPPPPIPQCRMRYDRFLLDANDRPQELGSEVFFAPYGAVRVSLLSGDRCMITITEKATGQVVEERFEPLCHWKDLREFNIALQLHAAMGHIGRRRYLSQDMATEQLILMTLTQHRCPTALRVHA